MTKKLLIKHATGLSNIQTDAKSIRNAVFVHEQKIPAELEFDEFDASTVHFVGYLKDLPVTTCRVAINADIQQAKIQRVATLIDYRGQHLASQLLESVLETLTTDIPVASITLDAQLPAQHFYEQLGFIPVGQQFEEAGIPHIQMTKTIKA